MVDHLKLPTGTIGTRLMRVREHLKEALDSVTGGRNDRLSVNIVIFFRGDGQHPADPPKKSGSPGSEFFQSARRNSLHILAVLVEIRDRRPRPGLLIARTESGVLRAGSRDRARPGEVRAVPRKASDQIQAGRQRNLLPPEVLERIGRPPIKEPLKLARWYSAVLTEILDLYLRTGATSRCTARSARRWRRSGP